MTVTTGGRGRRFRLVLFLVVVVEELGQQLCLALLTGIDQTDIGAELGREQVDHVVGQRLRGRHHLPLQEQEADDVAGRTVELGTQVTGGGPALDDDLGVGNRSRRRGVGGQLGRFELLEIATPAPGTPLIGATTTDARTARPPAATGPPPGPPGPPPGRPP